jgi:hypothetical protein
MVTERYRRLLQAQDLLPCAVGIPIVLSIALTVARLVAVRHLNLGWPEVIANDAKAVSFGQGLYGDPSEGYTGMLYTPLFPLLLAPFYKLAWWDGWPTLAGTFSAVGLAALVGLIATYDTDRRRGEAVVGGIGVAGVAWWLSSRNPRHLLYDGRADQLAWLFALGGLVALAWVGARSWRRVWPVVLLLSAALWTKQTTIGAMAAAVVVLGWWAFTGAAPRRVWVRFVAGLAATNAAVVGALMIWSRGWMPYFVLTLPGRHFSDTAVAPLFDELARLVVIPMVLLLMVGVATWSTGQWRRLDRHSFVSLLAVLLVVFLVLSIGPSWLARRKQGGEANAYIGVVWALGMLLAIGHRLARQNSTALATSVASYALLLAVIFVGPVRSVVTEHGVEVPPVIQDVVWVELDDSVYAYAEDHRVFMPAMGAITKSQGQAWPSDSTVRDMLAGGGQPSYLVDALIERRFDAVEPFYVDEYRIWYISAAGHTDASYLLLLNELMARGYADGANGAPSPLLGRRAGDVDLEWMRDCFDQAADAKRPGPGCLSAAAQDLLAGRPNQASN